MTTIGVSVFVVLVIIVITLVVIVVVTFIIVIAQEPFQQHLKNMSAI